MRVTRLPLQQIVILAIVFQWMVMSATSVPGQVPSPYRPDLDKLHEDFKLPSIEDGTPIRLSDFRGRKLLLFHFASW